MANGVNKDEMGSGTKIKGRLQNGLNSTSGICGESSTFWSVPVVV